MSSAFQVRGDVLTNSTLIKQFEKDAEGYSKAPGGEFNGNNVHGDFYPAEDAMPQLQPNAKSKIASDLREGTCYGEVGHPPYSDFDLPGVPQRESLARWFARLSITKPTLVSHHIKEISWDVAGNGDYMDRNNKVRIWLKVKPFGPYAQMVEESFNTPSMNSYFSVRSLCKPVPQSNGTRVMNMYELYTYDFVLRGGYASACKWKAAPGLEQYFKESKSPIIRLEDMEYARKLTQLMIANKDAGNEARNALGEMDRVIDAVRREVSGGESASRFLRRNSHSLWI